MLRDERHRLVSEIRRRDGTSHREINAWLNRKLGIASVEQATLSELERSVAPAGRQALGSALTRREHVREAGYMLGFPERGEIAWPLI